MSSLRVLLKPSNKTEESYGQKNRELIVRRYPKDEIELNLAPPIVHEVLRLPGHGLDQDTRTYMESQFGYDFSRVRVHTDAKAAESARAIKASAYTVGRNVVFGARQYEPETVKGHRLLTHELTHVVQQMSIAQKPVIQMQSEGQQVPPIKRPPWTRRDLAVWLHEDLETVTKKIDECDTWLTIRDYCKNKHLYEIRNAKGRFRLGMQLLRMVENGYTNPPHGTPAWEALNNPDELHKRALLIRVYTVARGRMFGPGSFWSDSAASGGGKRIVKERESKRLQDDPYYQYAEGPANPEDKKYTEDVERKVVDKKGKEPESQQAPEQVQASEETSAPEQSSAKIAVIIKRYEERIEIYRRYYSKPYYRNQEIYFSKAIINVISEIKSKLKEFENSIWIDCVSDFLQKRWFLGVKGVPAFEAKYGKEALKKFQDLESSKMWKEALRAAAAAETNPTSFNTNAKQEAAIIRYPKDIQKAFKVLKRGDVVFEDDKEYATYLQTIAHDYIDLSDAMVNCGCGSKKDWNLLIDILTDESAEGVTAWIGDVLGFADWAMEDFITLTMKRAARISAENKKSDLVCPKLD